MAAEKDASIVISGVVTGKVWGNATSANVYLQDEDGGYYVYGYACDQAKFDEIKVGAEYEVTGVKDLYYGTAEIKEAAFNDENVKRHTDGMEIIKVIVIKGKIVNIVVK